MFVVSTESGRPTCTRFEWTCDNGDCIPIDGHCDGRTECSDRSDERNCKHSNKSINNIIDLEGNNFRKSYKDIPLLLNFPFDHLHLFNLF